MSLFEHRDVSPDEAIRRAQAIKALATSEAFKWLVEEAVTNAHLDWESAQTVEAREAAHQHLMGIRSLDTQIHKAIDRGAAAQRALKPVSKP